MALDAVSLYGLLSLYNTNVIQKRLDEFDNPLNRDVEFFLLHKAINFEKVGMSRTSLVYTTFKGENALVGYYSISNKPLNIGKKTWHKMSNSVKKKLMPMGYRSEQENYIVPGVLLGQLAKNYKYEKDQLVTGAEILDLAYEAIRVAWNLSGGTVLYLEAQNEPHLRDFYVANGFSQLLLREGKNGEATIPYVTPDNLHLYIKKLSDV